LHFSHFSPPFFLPFAESQETVSVRMEFLWRTAIFYAWFEEKGVRILNRLGPRRESRMDRIGTMASLQHGSTIIIIMIVMVDKVDGRCGRRNRWTVMASVTRAHQRKIYRIPVSLFFIERETSSSTTTASHRQQ
jgi:hypothetical protein